MQAGKYYFRRLRRARLSDAPLDGNPGNSGAPAKLRDIEAEGCEDGSDEAGPAISPLTLGAGAKL